MIEEWLNILYLSQINHKQWLQLHYGHNLCFPIKRSFFLIHLNRLSVTPLNLKGNGGAEERWESIKSKLLRSKNLSRDTRPCCNRKKTWNTLDHHALHTHSSCGTTFAWSPGLIRRWLLQRHTGATSPPRTPSLCSNVMGLVHVCELHIL